MTGTYVIDGFVFGQRRLDLKNDGRGILVKTTTIDKGAPTTQDVQVSGLNGRMMGRDYLPGMSITFEGTIYSRLGPNDATQFYADLESAWQNPAVREKPGVYSALEMLYPYTTRESVVYGRGRQINPTLGDVRKGMVGFTAQFDCVDNTFYDAVEDSFVVGLKPIDTGGFIPPFIPPIVLGDTARTDYTVINGGAETYPIFEISGPVTNPSILYPDLGITAVLETSVPSGVTVTIDTRPWKMTVLDQAGGSYAGKLKGALMGDLIIPKGSTLVAYVGQDLTGTSELRVRYRAARPLLGGN